MDGYAATPLQRQACMHLPSTRKVLLRFIAAFLLVASLGVSYSCMAAGPDRATRAAQVFDSFCLSASPNFPDIDRRATDAGYEVIEDRTLPMPNGQTMRQKNWLVPSADGAPTMLTTNDGNNGTLHVIVCGIYAPDIDGASIEHALSLLPRLGAPTRHVETTEGSSTAWWSARVGEMPPSENSQVMLAHDVSGLPGSSVDLTYKTPLSH